MPEAGLVVVMGLGLGSVLMSTRKGLMVVVVMGLQVQVEPEVGLKVMSMWVGGKVMVTG